MRRSLLRMRDTRRLAGSRSSLFLDGHDFSSQSLQRLSQQLVFRRHVLQSVLENILLGVSFRLHLLELVFEFTDPLGSSFSEGSLGSPVLGLAFGRRSVAAGLSSWFGPRRQNPLLGGDNLLNWSVQQTASSRVLEFEFWGKFHARSWWRPRGASRRRRRRARSNLHRLGFNFHLFRHGQFEKGGLSDEDFI